MNCTIPGANIKIMGRTLQALTKIGDELYLEAKPDCLQLATINMNKTAFTTFNFHETFFSTYTVAKSDENVTCKIHLKSALGVFKMRGPKEKKIELCHIKLERDATRIVFKLIYKQDVVIVHSLRLIDLEFVTVTYDKDKQTNQIGAPGSFFTQVLANFQLSDDDISFEINDRKITVRNYDVASTNLGRSIRSQVVLNSNEFNTYSITRDTNVTLSFKPFRAAIHFAEIFNLNVSLCFEIGGKPVVLLMRNPTFEVNFILSTISSSGETQTSFTTNSSKTNGNITRQDKNALDCVDWDSDFDGDVVKEKISNDDVDIIPESPRTKRLKIVFGRCWEDTYHESMVEMGEQLAPNSDSDGD